MQQDELELTRRLSALPEDPDPEAALVEIRRRVENGEGREPLPPDLFAGLDRRSRDAAVLVLHPTAKASDRPSTRGSAWRWWTMVASIAAAATIVGGAVVYRSGPAPSPIASEPPVPSEAETPPPRPLPTPPSNDPIPADVTVTESVIVLEALHDEDPRAKPKPPRGKQDRRRAANHRRARKVWRRGRLAYEDGDLETARAAFVECLSIDADHSLCLNTMGRLAAEDHDPARARALFQMAIEADPDNPYPMVNLATLDMVERKIDDADARLHEAARVAPELKVVQRLQARVDYLQTLDHHPDQ